MKHAIVTELIMIHLPETVMALRMGLYQYIGRTASLQLASCTDKVRNKLTQLHRPIHTYTCIA